MKQCRSYASFICYTWGIFAVVVAIALMAISSNLNNWWYFFGGCSIYTLLIGPVLAFAAHLDAMAEQIEQNDQIIDLLKGNIIAPENVNSAPAAIVEQQETPEETKVEEAPTYTAVNAVKAPVADENGFVRCPVCKYKQRYGRGNCFECGVIFK